MNIFVLTSGCTVGSSCDAFTQELEKELRAFDSRSKNAFSRLDVEDEFEKVKEALMSSDSVALVVPVTNYAVPAQFKRIINKLSGIVRALRVKKRKIALVALCASSDENMCSDLVSHYRMIVRFLSWESVGVIVMTSVSVAQIKMAEATEKIKKLAQALL